MEKITHLSLSEIHEAASGYPDARNLNYLAAVRCIASEARPKLRGHRECAVFEASAGICENRAPHRQPTN
jgi:hypothetical protein